MYLFFDGHGDWYFDNEVKMVGISGIAELSGVKVFQGRSLWENGRNKSLMMNSQNEVSDIFPY